MSVAGRVRSCAESSVGSIGKTWSARCLYSFRRSRQPLARSHDLLEPSRLPVAPSIPKAHAEHCCLLCVKGMVSSRVFRFSEAPERQRVEKHGGSSYAPVGEPTAAKFRAAWKVPSLLPKSTETLLDKKLATTRCCTPSPLKSLTATETGLLPTSKSPRAMKDTPRLGLHRRRGLHSPQRQHYANDRPCLLSWFVNHPAPATPRSFSACCRTASDSVSCAAMRKPVRPGAESQKVRAWRSLSSGRQATGWASRAAGLAG